MQGLRTLSNIRQLCIVVESADEAMRRFHRLLGVERFNIYTVDAREIPGIYYYGQPANYVARVGIAQLGDWEFELAEPVSGDSIYRDFLRERGEGTHHIGMVVDDYGECKAELTRRFGESIMGGPIPGINRDGWFDYFDSVTALGCYIELLDQPEERAEPSEVYAP